jgi:hypothetical protein
MTRIDITDIIFDLARMLSEAGCLVKPPWGPVFMTFGIGLATVAVRLIMVKQNRLTARRSGQ